MMASGATSSGRRPELHAEVDGLGVVGDDGQGGLLGLDGVAAGEADADVGQAQQARDLLVLGLLG
jgi:hypothetical protein